MTISKATEGSKLTLSVSGRLDTTTSPELETEYKASIDGITDLVIDFSGLEYISSSGLRVLLSMQKVMNKQGSMVLKNVCADVMDILDVTGFSDILTIE